MSKQKDNGICFLVKFSSDSTKELKTEDLKTNFRDLEIQVVNYADVLGTYILIPKKPQENLILKIIETISSNYSIESFITINREDNIDAKMVSSL